MIIIIHSCAAVWQLRSGQTKLLHSCPSYTTSHQPQWPWRWWLWWQWWWWFLDAITYWAHPPQCHSLFTQYPGELQTGPNFFFGAKGLSNWCFLKFVFLTRYISHSGEKFVTGKIVTTCKHFTFTSGIVINQDAMKTLLEWLLNLKSWSFSHQTLSLS